MKKGQYRLMYRQEDSYWWFLAKRRFIGAILPKRLRNLKILDIGCGTGGLTHFISKWGQVTAIEPAGEAYKYLKKRNIRYLPITFDKYQEKKKFDLVCFFDVLYHQNIDDDEKEIAKAYKHLKPGGLLLITDCALPFLFGLHDRVMCARERYYLKDLSKKVTSAGFKIQKASYMYFFVFPFFVIMRLFQKFSTKETITPLPKIINNILLALCTIEARYLTHVTYPIGSSVIILAKRPNK